MAESGFLLSGLEPVKQTFLLLPGQPFQRL
jgi:hypothetical protein